MRVTILARILALVACKEAHEGPWLRTQGHESGVKVYPELVGEEKVEVIAEQGHSVTVFAVGSGFTPLPLAMATRYRARKLGYGSPTSVEIVLNGQAQRESRNPHNSGFSNR